MTYEDPFAKITGNIPQPNRSGVVPYSAGSSFQELLGALMQQQQYNRGIEEQSRMRLQGQAELAPRQARAGVQMPEQQMAAQAAQSAAAPRQQFTDPMIEAVMAQRMQQALSDQYLQQMRTIMAQNQPSFLQKYGGLIGTLGGMGMGGLYADPISKGGVGGLAGAQFGGQLGGLFGQIPRF